jgi:tripartite-type tricarboxylate transporter receptor subunit TctC
MTLLLRAAAALLLLAAPAFAQTWPAKQVRIVVPFPAGGSADILCRLVAEKFSAAWGQTVIIDNRAGAGGNVGAEVVWRAEPDGYILLCSPPGPLSINHNLYKTLPYDWSKFSAIGVLALVPNVITARPDLPQASLRDFVAHAKANPGKIFYGHFNASSQVPGALLQRMAGIEMTAVPYKAIGNCFNDIMGGQIQAMFVDTTAGASHVNQGQLRPLGVTRPQRWDKRPDVPAIAEFYPGFELTGFLGMALPVATPKVICERLNTLINAAILSPDVKDRLESFGFTPRAMTLDECAAFSKSEREKWKRYVEIAGIEKQ